MEIFKVEKKLEALNKIVDLVPTSANYSDLMKNEGIEELESYRMFEISEGNEYAFAGISTYGPAFNIYSNSYPIAKKLYLKSSDSTVYLENGL